MENFNYDAVEDTIQTQEAGDKISRKYLLRQILVCSSIWTSYFCYGLSLGLPTVLIPQIRREANSSDAVSTEMASWLSSAFNYSGIVGAIMLAILARLIGRKLSHLFICVTSLLSYILLYFSSSTTEILISEIVQGPLFASTMTISVMVLTECISPRYRGVFLSLKSPMYLWGIWVSNAIGTFLHWKNIVILASVCSVYSFVSALLWCESPYWLANKNRFEDCAASHRWLKGCSKESEAELDTLIKSRENIKFTSTKSLNIYRKVITMIRSKSFYKPILLSLLVVALYHLSGKFACAMYAIDIIKRITGKESTAYTGMLILDGITALGMYVGCGLSKILKRRTFLLTSSSIGVTFLFSISLYLYLIHFDFISENNTVSMSLLTGYSLTISAGPMIMATTILGELIPVKYRSSSVLLLCCFANLLMGSIVKISPFILEYFGVRGLFLFFSISAFLITILNYKLLPETKDKTILEIQKSLLGTD